MDKQGIVYIVGAGPGDPGLITIKGLVCLRKAGVLLYDRLVHPSLLSEAPVTAERIDVGKAPARHRCTQAEINALLITKAREGKTVVRLKGGDPFVFGRGAEECQALAEAGIPFEVVSGVTSAIGVAAYAGIPVTRRNIANALAVVVVTGHMCTPDHTLDWEALARSPTLIFMMGMAHLPEIAKQLVAHGRSPDTPVALIERGTTANQVVVQGRLVDIVSKAGLRNSPVTIIIGDVVNLRQQLNWFDPASASAFSPQRSATRFSEPSDFEMLMADSPLVVGGR